MGDRLVQAIVLVADLAGARRRLESAGFRVEDGGRHPGRGTANLIVPFGAQYLEVLAVVDRDEAVASPHGRPVVTALDRRGVGLARWSVEAADIEAAGQRLRLPVERRQRVRPDGVTVGWRSVGVDEAWPEPWRCAFMAWDDARTHPAHTSARHPNGASGFAGLTVEAPVPGDVERWLGDAVPEGVRVTPGGRGPCALAMTTPSGPLPLAQIGI